MGRRIQQTILYTGDYAPYECLEEELLADEFDLPMDPGESELGYDTFEEIVFGKDTYNDLCEAVRGVRIWDLPEDFR